MIYYLTNGVILYAKGRTEQTVYTGVQERIYLTEGPEGFAVERRGRGRKGGGRAPKPLPKQVEEDLLAEVQRLRAEVDYLKNLQALVLEDERRQRKKRW